MARVVIVGAQCTGKTTLWNALREDHMKIAVAGSKETGVTNLACMIAWQAKHEFIREAAGEAFERGFTLDANASLLTEFWIACRQAELERKAGSSWVSDRSLIDTLAYTYLLFSGDMAVIHAMERLARPQIESYDIVIYLPIEFPMQANGIRSEDVEFQKKVDEKIRVVLDAWVGEYHTVTGQLHERVDKVAKIFRERLGV